MQNRLLPQETTAQEGGVSILPGALGVETTETVVETTQGVEEIKQVRDAAQQAALQASFALVQRHAMRRRRAWKVFWGAWGVMMTASLLGGIPTITQGYIGPISLFAGCNILTLLSIIVMLSTIPINILTSRKIREAMLHLIDTDDLSIIGPLLDTAHSNNRQLQSEALTVLAHLLPHLKASDASLLSDQDRRQIYRYLNRTFLRVNFVHGSSEQRERYTEFVIAALGALEQIGDAAALKPVEALAEHCAALGSRGTVQDAQSARMSEAAKACLPVLQMRIEQTSSQQGLLRPSGVSEAPNGTLLRPAHENAETPSEQLLRLPDPPA